MKPPPPDDLDRAVVVLIAQVSHLGPALEAFDRELNAPERERASHFRFPEDRARFVAGRGLLRHGLARFAPHVSAPLELVYTSLGRPLLPGDDQALQFSISHTGDLVAVALTRGAQVGIDLEQMKPTADLTALAERVLSPADFRAFQELPTGDQLPVFYRAWTRKEAYLKALGEGIATGLQDVSVSFGPETVSTLVDGRNAGSVSWSLHLLPLPAGYAGALACDDSSRAVRWHRFQSRDGDIVERE